MYVVIYKVFYNITYQYLLGRLPIFSLMNKNREVRKISTKHIALSVFFFFTSTNYYKSRLGGDIHEIQTFRNSYYSYFSFTISYKNYHHNEGIKFFSY